MKFLPRFTNGEHLYGNNDAIPFSNPRRAYLLEIILKKKENRSEYSETKFFQTHPQGFLNFARILCYNYVKIALFSLPSPKHLRGMLCVANVGRNDNRAGRLPVSSSEIINSKRRKYLVSKPTKGYSMNVYPRRF